MNRYLNILLTTLGLFCVAGCSSKLRVEEQAITVASDPIGAAVFADGTFQGNTPTVVSLTKDREHIITVTKEGHGVHMIPVHLVKDDMKDMQEAVLDGVHDGLFYQDPLWAVTSARAKLEKSEKSGKHARLEPSSICLKLEQIPNETK